MTGVIDNVLYHMNRFSETSNEVQAYLDAYVAGNQISPELYA